MAVQSINQELCNGCGICADDCPTDVFAMDNEAGKAYLAYPDDCGECKLCPYFCPAGAINYTRAIPDKLFFPY